MRGLSLFVASLLAGIAVVAAARAAAAAQGSQSDSPDERRRVEQALSTDEAEAWTRVGIDPAEAQQWVRAGIPYAEWANQFRDEGFGPADAGVWVEHQVNVYTAGQFRAAGFSASEATAWIAGGVRSARRAQEFQAQGFSPAEAGEWWALGFRSDEAVPWRAEAFEAAEAQAWKYGDTEYFYMSDGSRNSARTVYAVEWAREWRAAGFSPVEARLADAYGVEVAEAREWLAQGFRFADAMVWRDSGFAPVEAAAGRSEGLGAVEAAARRREGEPRPADTIEAWHSDVVLRTDATLEIVDTIEFSNGPGGPIGRCLERTFPARVDLRRSASRYTTAWPSYDVASVLLDGEPAPYSLVRDRSGDRTLCLGGRPSVPEGPHTLTLRYTTDDRLIDLHNHDRLFLDVVPLDVTGDLAVGRASAAVHLPRGANTVRADGFAGLPMRKDFDAEVHETPDGDVVYYTVARPLERDMGFAVAVSLPKGFARPGLWWRVRRFDRAEGRLVTSLLLVAVGLSAALVYFRRAWRRVGRDAARRAIVPVYEPPEGVTPALMRYLVARQRVDDRTLAATLVRLAHCGALVIHEREGLYKIEKTGHGTEDGARYEARFLDRLFEGTDVLILGTRSARRRLRAARRELRASLRAERAKHVAANTRYLWPGLALSGATAAIGLAVVSLPDEGMYAYGLFLATVVAAMNLTFWRLLKAPTASGRRVLDAVEGFRRFLEAAYGAVRVDEVTGSVDAPPTRAEHLPYAIAVGADSERASVLDRRTTWYEGRSGGFSVADFTASLQRMRPRRLTPQAVRP